MNNNSTKIVTLIPSSTEIVAFLGQKNSIIDVLMNATISNRPGPRLLESLEIFAEIMHPDLFNFNNKRTGWINYHA